MAIGHRVWKYEGEESLKIQHTKVDSYYETHLRNLYDRNQYRLKEATKKRNSFSKYMDSLAVVQYLVENEEIENLRAMWMETGVSYHVSRDRLLLGFNSQMYSYANDLVEYYLASTKQSFFENVEMDIGVLFVGETDDQKSELAFDFYSVFGEDTKVAYIAGDEELTKVKGGVYSAEPLEELTAILIDKFTGETKKYIFDDNEIR